MRRIADRGADIGTGVEPRQAGGQRRGRSPRGAAGCPGQVPRIVAGAVDLIETLPVRQHERHIGLAEQHGASTAVPCDEGRVRISDVAAVLRSAPGRGRTCQVEAFLHGDRQALKWACILARRAAAIRSVGFRTGPLDVPPNDGVERGIVSLNTVEKMIQQFPRTDFPPVEQRQQLGG